MPAMPTEYTLSELAKLAGVSARTVRYYIAQGLLPAPIVAGPNARYSEAHLDRIRLIKRLQGAHLPLADIRRQLATLGNDDVASLTDSAAPYEQPADSALDYIEALLSPSKPTFAIVLPPRAAVPNVMRRAEMPSAMIEPAPIVQPAPAIEPAAPMETAAAAPAQAAPRSQWERIALDPDIELHVRRPLTRQHNKQVERLIAIARELLKED